MAYKGLDSISVSDIEATGVTSQLAHEIYSTLIKIINIYGPATPETWQTISTTILTPQLPFLIHQMMYYGCYKDFGPDPPAWIPAPYVFVDGPCFILLCMCLHLINMTFF